MVFKISFILFFPQGNIFPPNNRENIPGRRRGGGFFLFSRVYVGQKFLAFKYTVKKGNFKTPVHSKSACHKVFLNWPSPCVSRIVDRFGQAHTPFGSPRVLPTQARNACDGRRRGDPNGPRYIFMCRCIAATDKFLIVISSNQQNYTQRKNIISNVFDSYYTVTYFLNAFYRLKSGASFRSDVLFMEYWFGLLILSILKITFSIFFQFILNLL